MWGLDTIYRNMPDEWVTYQEMCFVDANTFLAYNQNMRQLVYDKLNSAELVVFNRCEDCLLYTSWDDTGESGQTKGAVSVMIHSESARCAFLFAGRLAIAN